MIKFQSSDHLGDENSLYWEKQAKGPKVLPQGSLFLPQMILAHS